MFMTIARQILAISLLSLILLACTRPEAVVLTHLGYNERLRLDREPLTPEQALAERDDLRHGPYRVGEDRITTALVPLLAGPVQHLPQSDCWWLAQATHGGGDAVRAHWEAVYEIGAGQGFEDPEDGRVEIGACRINDPETRRPPLAVGRDTETHADIFLDETPDPSRLLRGTLANGDNLPRIQNDQFVLLEGLDAMAPDKSDVTNSCSERLGRFNRVRTAVVRGTDGFDGASGEGRVSSCTRADGALLLPSVHTQYVLHNPVSGKRQPLEPALLVARRDDTTIRPLLSAAGAASWQASVTSRSGLARWSENFSPNLRVSQVRLLRLVAGRPEYLPDSPALCIVDPDTGSDCRWRCVDTDPAPDSTRYDLASGSSCTNAQGVAAIPDVNPTFSLGTWRAAPLQRPLEWRFGFAPASPVHVEFTLGTALGGMALLAEPEAVDLGRVRAPERRIGRFSVSNLGEVGVRVVRAAIDPGWRQASAFSLRLPFAPEALPVGVEMRQVAARTFAFSLPREFESRGLVAMFGAENHWHLRPAETPRTPFLVDGVAVSVRDGMLYRDRPEQTIVYRPPDAATFAPVRSAVWAQRTVPFMVGAGARFDLLVTAAPTSPGRKEARVLIEAESVHDPAQRQTLAVTVAADALTGPVPWLGPAQRYWDARQHDPPPANFLLVNNGDVPIVGVAVRIAAEDGGPIAAVDDRFRLLTSSSGSVGVGASEVLSVAYEPKCGNGGEVEHRAALWVETAAGQERSLLLGRSPSCP